MQRISGCMNLSGSMLLSSACNAAPTRDITVLKRLTQERLPWPGRREPGSHSPNIDY